MDAASIPQPTLKPWCFGSPEMERMMADALNQMESIIKFQELLATASWKRKLVAGVGVIATVVAGGYFAGTLITYMGTGAALLGASSFMTLMIYLIGSLLAILAAMRASKVVLMYVLSGKIDTHVDAAWNFIKSPFKRKVKA